MDLPSVSYVIVTMNRRDELIDCLQSLREQDYPEKQIVVVDNASSDDTVATVRSRFPEALLIAQTTNTFATGGRNRGVAAASGEICIILDDDARLAHPDATRKTIEYFRADSELGCVSYRIFNAFTGKDDIKSIPRRDKKVVPHDYPCTYMCAAGFAIRRDVALETGLFWEKLGMYAEEVDLGYRILDRGYKIVFSSSIIVEHRETPRARPTGRWIYFTTRNRCWIALRSLPWPNVIVATLAWWLLLGVKSLRDRQCGFYLRGIRDALAGAREVVAVRSRLRASALQKLKTLSGRYWS
jgi:GT2 family glycosyltransferase